MRGESTNQTTQAGDISTAAIHIGCSGWNYRHWRGAFYPEGLPARCWFEHYSKSFDTVEINASFYGVPAASTFDKWRNAAPPGFRYAVKANRFLTHVKKLREVAEETREFIERARGLGETLGPILYQLPPRWRLDRDRLGAFADLLPRDLDHVFEFREPSWMSAQALAFLDSLGLGFCTHDMMGMEVPRAATGRLAYIRFHGTSGKYIGRYDAGAIGDWAQWIVSQARAGRPVWAYFNNDIHAHAIDDAAALRGAVDQLLSTSVKAATAAPGPAS